MVSMVPTFAREQAGHRTCVIDFDIGLRNMDLHLGCERRVIFDFVNVIQVLFKLNLPFYPPLQPWALSWLLSLLLTR